jgi:hypothetical protein
MFKVVLSKIHIVITKKHPQDGDAQVYESDEEVFYEEACREQLLQAHDESEEGQRRELRVRL